MFHFKIWRWKLYFMWFCSAVWGKNRILWSCWAEQDTCLWSRLVTHVGERVNRVTAAGLTSRRSVQVPVSVLTLVTEDAHHPRPAGTLPCPWITETGTPQRTPSHLRPPSVTGALCQIHNTFTNTVTVTVPPWSWELCFKDNSSS